MKRVKWFEIKWNTDFSGIYKILKQAPYTREGVSGFIIDHAGKSCVEGRYIEKFIQNFSVRDPFGGITEFAQPEFRTVDFKMFDSGPNLELLDPPRGLQGFWAKLAELFEFGISIEEINTPTIRLVDAIEHHFGEKAIINSMLFSDIELQKNIHASITLKETNDLRKFLKGFCGQYHCEPQKIHLTIGDKPLYQFSFNDKASFNFARTHSTEEVSWARMMISK